MVDQNTLESRQKAAWLPTRLGPIVVVRAVLFEAPHYGICRTHQTAGMAQ